MTGSDVEVGGAGVWHLLTLHLYMEVILLPPLTGFDVEVGWSGMWHLLPLHLYLEVILL